MGPGLRRNSRKGDAAIRISNRSSSAPVQELDKLLAAAHLHAALVAIGSRGLDSSLIRVPRPWHREVAGRRFSLLARAILNFDFRDTWCGFKLFRIDAARGSFARQRSTVWGGDAEILYFASKLSFRSIEVPVPWSHAKGSKIRVLTDGFKMFCELIRSRLNDLRGFYTRRGAQQFN